MADKYKKGKRRKKHISTSDNNLNIILSSDGFLIRVVKCNRNLISEYGMFFGELLSFSILILLPFVYFVYLDNVKKGE